MESFETGFILDIQYGIYTPGIKNRLRNHNHKKVVVSNYLRTHVS